ncbi:phosphatidylinositol-glycan biosynthesis class X protein [Eurytemora carolleeae]|uniref:phosphatidylinositol-glycan biosynthesis class X protein n=1 Tax=Eurytemora carolleeae TaxID=1294199 RepID=UPI000C76411F|nr:phosphatidylinositol-glycan biosynthesis class X protein [Eurytemora carolleeae]|eukprot:XP_023347214.1 phosphatidylinositol-glycan biosynthesis class X protein-like [Eurytemora affinis]
MILEHLLLLSCIYSIASGQGKSVGVQGGEGCPLLSGVYVSVMRRIFHPGMQKQILTEIELMLTSTLLPETCHVLVEETIPRGAYVDPDELLDRKLRTGLNAYIPARVDIEKPEFESEAFRDTLVIYGSLNCIMLPIHTRYHKPGSSYKPGDKPSAILKIQNPRILLSCEGEDITENCTGRAVVNAYCPQFESKCQYVNLPYKINVASLEVSVPVGDVEDSSLVVGVTTLVTCGATVYLLITMFRTSK